MNVDIEQRLARRFDLALAEARHDYPSLRRTEGPAVGNRHRWRKLAAGFAGLGLLLVAGLVGVGPAFRSASDSVPGAGGFPTQIDSERVYWVDDDVLYLSGSFLIAGYVGGDGSAVPSRCANGRTDTQAQLDLAPSCGFFGLQDRLEFPNDPATGIRSWTLAPKSAAIYQRWSGAAVVVRAHFHDPEAAQCPGDSRDECDKSLVVEAVVWGSRQTVAANPSPAAGTIPPTIDGQKVYTLAEQDNIPGSFLLRAYAVTAYIPCPATIDTPSTSADLDIYPNCGSVSLVPAPSGNSAFFFALAPKTRDLLTPWLAGPEIVIRVHHHDPAAAGCSAVFRSQCETALVVEAVVWPSSAPSPAAAAATSVGP